MAVYFDFFDKTYAAAIAYTSHVLKKGDKFDYSLAFKSNNTKIYGVGIRFGLISGESISPVYFSATHTKKLSAGTTGRINGSITMPDTLQDLSSRYSSVACEITLFETPSLSSGTVSYPTFLTDLTLIKTLGYSVATFDACRVNESGEEAVDGKYLAISAKVDANDANYIADASASIYFKLDGAAEYTDQNKVSINAESLYSWISNDSSLLSNTVFLPSEAYDLKLVFGDSYEEVSSEYSILKSRANFHLAASKHGVGIGQYSGGTEEDPRFDCAYPAYFYEGIAETERVISMIKRIACDVCHPVGSFYICGTDANPSDMFGGVWEKHEDMFLVAAGTDFKLKVTGGEMSHKHIAPVGYNTANNIFGITYAQGSSSGAFNGTFASTGNKVTTSSGNYTWMLPHTNSASNLPPYLPVSVWERIS